MAKMCLETRQAHQQPFPDGECHLLSHVLIRRVQEGKRYTPGVVWVVVSTQVDTNLLEIVKTMNQRGFLSVDRMKLHLSSGIETKFWGKKKGKQLDPFLNCHLGAARVNSCVSLQPQLFCYLFISE